MGQLIVAQHSTNYHANCWVDCNIYC